MRKKKQLKRAKPPAAEHLDELEKILTVSTNKVKSPKSKNEATALADMIRIRHRRRLIRIVVISTIIALLILIIGLWAFLKYWVPTTSSINDITIEINGPDQLPANNEAAYTIRYANNGQVDIQNAKLIYNESSSFLVTDTAPAPNGRSWDLGDIAAGQSGEVNISGKFFDAPGTTHQIKATLIFVPVNFNSEFSRETVHAVTLQTPEIDITTTITENITLGEKLLVGFTLTNMELETIDRARVHLMAPPHFIPSDTTPKPETEALYWDITDFEPHTELTFKVEGRFPTELTFENINDRVQEFVIKLEYPNSENIFYTQIEHSLSTKIVDQALSSIMIINGSTDNKSISLGDTLHFSAIYKNKGTETYQDLKVIAYIEAQPDHLLDWSALTDENFGTIEKSGNGRIITWTGSRIAELREIKPNEEYTIDFSIPVKSADDIAIADLTGTGKGAITAYTSLQLTDDTFEMPSIDSSPVTLNLTSNVRLINQALYFYPDGTPIGTGPLPPQANESTNYVVFWEINNELHELTNITVTTTLPEEVTWLHKSLVSAGTLNYNNSTRSLTWTLNRLPLGVDKASVNFTLELTPTTEHVGKLMKLLNTTTLAATDASIEAPITITTGVLTTNLDNDEFGIGKGIVQPAF